MFRRGQWQDLLMTSYMHGRNLMGDGGRVPPLFQTGGT